VSAYETTDNGGMVAATAVSTAFRDVYIDHHVLSFRLTSSNSVLSLDDHCISIDSMCKSGSASTMKFVTIRLIL
jgi:hypothetical protein